MGKMRLENMGEYPAGVKSYDRAEPAGFSDMAGWDVRAYLPGRSRSRRWFHTTGSGLPSTTRIGHFLSEPEA
jgi:hypothetical protein